MSGVSEDSVGRNEEYGANMGLVPLLFWPYRERQLDMVCKSYVIVQLLPCDSPCPLLGWDLYSPLLTLVAQTLSSLVPFCCVVGFRTVSEKSWTCWTYNYAEEISPFSLGLFVSCLQLTARPVGPGADKRLLMGNSSFKQQLWAVGLWESRNGLLSSKHTDVLQTFDLMLINYMDFWIVGLEVANSWIQLVTGTDSRKRTATLLPFFFSGGGGGAGVVVVACFFGVLFFFLGNLKIPILLY